MKGTSCDLLSRNLKLKSKAVRVVESSWEPNRLPHQSKWKEKWILYDNNSIVSNVLGNETFKIVIHYLFHQQVSQRVLSSFKNFKNKDFQPCKNVLWKSFTKPVPLNTQKSLAARLTTSSFSMGVCPLQFLMVPLKLTIWSWEVTRCLATR
jgi:hypothetical protein